MLAQCWNLVQQSNAQAQESLHVRALSSLEFYITLALGKGEGLELKTNRTMPIIQPRRQGNTATLHNQKRSDPEWQLPQIGSELFFFFKTQISVFRISIFFVKIIVGCRSLVSVPSSFNFFKTGWPDDANEKIALDIKKTPKCWPEKFFPL